MTTIQKVFTAASVSLCMAASLLAQQSVSNHAADVNSPAEFTVTEKVVRRADKVPPLGCLGSGGTRLINYAANDIIRESSCGEPIVWRDYCMAAKSGDDWFEVEWPGDNSIYGTVASGFLSGANVRIYREVDKDGNPLPEDQIGVDSAIADHFILVGQTRIIPEGDKDFPYGGWIVGKFGLVHRYESLQGDNVHCMDNAGTENGKTYWYTVVALLPNADRKKPALESLPSNEAIATPQPGVDTPPGVLPQTPFHSNPVEDESLKPMIPQTAWAFSPRAYGGIAPLKWSVVDEHGADTSLPAGLSMDPATGAISGKVATALDPFKLGVKVTDAKGRSDTRYYAINADAPVGTTQRPLPPTELKAVAGDGCVMLSWKASPSSAVAFVSPLFTFKTGRSLHYTTFIFSSVTGRYSGSVRPSRCSRIA